MSNEINLFSQKIICFLNEAEKSDKPLMTHLGYYTEGKKVLTLWCGTGDENPLQRIEEQNKEIAFYRAINSDMMKQMKEIIAQKEK
jgi:hypothetical protein